MTRLACKCCKRMRPVEAPEGFVSASGRERSFTGAESGPVSFDRAAVFIVVSVLASDEENKFVH